MPPYPIIDSAKAVLDSNGNGKFYFKKVNNGYRVFKHRNSIETWSATPVPFMGDTTSFNFTKALSQAYGNNMIQTDNDPVRFAICNGNVKKDGIVDATDAGAIGNDAADFVTGYVYTDVTGDNVIDALDAALADNNSLNFVSAVIP